MVESVNPADLVRQGYAVFNARCEVCQRRTRQVSKGGVAECWGTAGDKPTGHAPLVYHSSKGLR